MSFQQARLRLLDQVELLLRVEHVDLDRQVPAQHVEQRAQPVPRRNSGGQTRSGAGRLDERLRFPVRLAR